MCVQYKRNPRYTIIQYDLIEHWVKNQEPSVLVVNQPLTSFVILSKLQKVAVLFIFAA